MEDYKKNAKLDVLKRIRAAASKKIMGDIKAPKKVTVASDSKEGLEKGLDLAKEVTHQMPESTEDLGDFEKNDEPVEEAAEVNPSDRIAKLEDEIKKLHALLAAK